MAESIPTPRFSEQALDAGVAAWFGVTKVEAERNFIRDRMSAAVLAVLEQMTSDAPTAPAAAPARQNFCGNCGAAMHRLHACPVMRDGYFESLAAKELSATPEAAKEELDELYRALSVVGVVGQIEGHDVIRRLSVLDIVRSRQIRKEVT